MDIKYTLTNDVLLLEDSEFILTYGIQATNPENGETLETFNDVSVSKSFTCRIIDILNSCKVELCHFRDVVLDELNR